MTSLLINLTPTLPESYQSSGQQVCETLRHTGHGVKTLLAHTKDNKQWWTLVRSLALGLDLRMVRSPNGSLVQHRCCSHFPSGSWEDLKLLLKRIMLHQGPFPVYYFTLVITTLTSSHLNMTVHENLGNQHSSCCLRDLVLNPQGLLQAQFAKSLLSSAQAALVHLEHLLPDTQWVLSLALVDGHWRRQKGLNACCQE